MLSHEATERSDQRVPEIPVSEAPSLPGERPGSPDESASEKEKTTLESLGLRTLADFIKAARQGNGEASHQ